MAEVKMGNVRDLLKIDSGTTISSLNDKYSTISETTTSINNTCDKLQREINRIKKYSRRKNWVGNKNNTYKRRRSQ